ncbi:MULTISPECIES: hypothetical protein [Hwangdonia]|uniref:Uncharacterized protein n=1 Tax=Hwangdonia seohaensis TaxID=1240727 RepID=A0ABW3R960_9FLAO|nr:hypothetical protein [Hwangdonia seohaensis]
MKLFIIIFMMGFGFLLNAQEVNFNGHTYTVKGKSILKKGTDVTSTLTVEEQQQIRAAFNKKRMLAKASEKKEKQIKKAKKSQKIAEKKQKKAEKALKRKRKAQSNFDKSAKKYEHAIEKYERLEKKGDLSPEDEVKWLKKIEKLKAAHKKAEKKLKHV